ncbi:protein FAM83H [Mugil cephalus]|uniref:protein FAM83H n=1 Tax=Mugil cephalus TaxID=48193 RepID=UPI001FB5AAF7|nr:protein FAM83H [Mugil cephalus]
MARRSQCSSAGDNPLDPNYLPPHYREEYRLAIDSLIEKDLEGYYEFLQNNDVVDFLSTPEIQYIQNSVQVPQQSGYPEPYFQDSGGDGSSDTYWPIHSDLDVPGLDLGWPQVLHFIGPTEVTTLVNPPEPDMPSIKEQARRLIKNAQQVIGIVMDMFTDVDMFADILDATMRKVAVYIILDEQNAHHFINMVSNCRVNLQTIQFLRVRTVSGITYQCRSGKSFKGQMMDRFLLTDCRAVLSGNYSFMWSFEKLHRCMAHLFLGQLVTTFDEEFRILFAQSQPLMIENLVAPLEDLHLSQNRKFLSDRTSIYREPRRFLSLESGHPDEWARQSYEERMEGDWRTNPNKRQGSLRGPADMYRLQQSRMDPSFDQGPPRVPMMETPAFKRPYYVEGVQGRHSFLQQQGMPDSEGQGRHFLRGHQPYPGPGLGPVPGPGPGQGPEADYSSYDKFWDQDCLSTDQYPEPGLPQGMPPSNNFDPVLNYLSSTRNPDFDQSSEKLLSAGDLPFSSPYPKRPTIGQPYACKTSPTPSNQSDQKHFLQEPSGDRKDPKVKRGLRNWRISSYLSASDNPGDEGLPLAPPQAFDPFEEPSGPVQQMAPDVDLPSTKIPNVREFKVPRISQMPSYTKMSREQPKKLPDETETKTTPTPSESSSTAEGEKTEETEQKEPKTAVLRRDDSFRRNYNKALQRNSRLRSSLIFSSMDQPTPQDGATATSDQQDEDSDKNDAEQTKLPYVSQLLGQRRSATREPIEWSRYIKSKPEDGSGKTEEKDSSKEENSSTNPEAQDSIKLPEQAKPSEAELPKTDQLIQSLSGAAYVDMNDPDNRLMFFKELAAKRKAAEAEKSKKKAQVKPPDQAVKKEEPVPKETSKNNATEDLLDKNATAEGAGKTVSTEACEAVGVSASKMTSKQDSLDKTESKSSQSWKEETKSSDTVQLEGSQSAEILPVSAEPEASPKSPEEEPHLSIPAVKESPPLTQTNATSADVSFLAQGTVESETPSLESTSEASNPVTPSSEQVPSSSVLESITQNPSSEQLESNICSSPPPSKDTGLEVISSGSLVRSSSVDPTPDSLASSSTPLPSPGDSVSSNVTPEDSHSASTVSSPNSDTQEFVKSADDASQKSENVSDQSHLDLEVHSVHEEPDISSNACASQPTTSKTNSNLSAATPLANKSENVAFEPASESAQEVSKLEEEASEPDKGVCEPVKYVSESEKDVFELERGTSGSENGVSQSTKDTSELEIGVSESEKDISETTNDVSESEICSSPKTDKCEVLSSSEDVKVENTSPSPISPGPESSVSDLENFTSKSEETISAIPPSDFITNVPQSETTTSSADTPIQAERPTSLSLKGFDECNSAETVSHSTSLSESASSPGAKTTETNMPALQSLPDANSISNKSPPESDKDKSPTLSSTKSPTSPAEPIAATPTETDLPCRTQESVTSDSNTSETVAENSKTEPEVQDKCENKSEETSSIPKSSTQEQTAQNNSSEAAETTTKQTKSSPSRYHSSTANVISSSNLRDDTKLLLEQISANSQTRNEAAKEAPVTDDEKEDEADKKSKREKYRTYSRGQPKPTEEREKLLERIQSMRKERKVYSRFEMAP